MKTSEHTDLALEALEKNTASAWEKEQKAYAELIEALSGRESPRTVVPDGAMVACP